MSRQKGMDCHLIKIKPCHWASPYRFESISYSGLKAGSKAQRDTALQQRLWGGLDGVVSEGGGEGDGHRHRGSRAREGQEGSCPNVG